MPWLDDIKILYDWLTNPPPNTERGASTSVVALASSGHGFYAEGLLTAGNQVITGKLVGWESKDRWLPDPASPSETYPFDPEKFEDVPVSISTTSGAVKISSRNYAQPVSVFGSSLATATSHGSGIATPWQTAIPLRQREWAAVT